MPTDAQRRQQSSDHYAEVQKLNDRIEQLEAIEASARNLVKVKGRYHTEQAFKDLVALLVNTTAEQPARAQEQR